MKSKYLLIFIIFMIGASSGFSKEKPVKMIEKGQFKEAIKHYDRVIKEHPNWTEAHFGKGVALYKEQNIEEAVKEFENSIAAKNDIQKSAAYYNLGNILLDSQKPDEALNFYRKSLELNSKDIDAKHNFELAKRMLQQQQKQQQQDQNNENQDDQNKENQNKDQKKKQDQKNKQDKKDQQNQQQDKEKEKKEDEKKQQDQQQNEDQKKSEKKKQEQPQPQPNPEEQKKKNMKKQEAAQILNSLKQNQKDMMKKRVKVKTSGSKKEKDW